MQMEDLTKTQIVLLTLLVSFVTSIATGIVTVTLMDQAPSDVIKVFSRVIERKVPIPTDTLPSKSQTPTETIVVKEEDLITESLEKNSKALVRLYEMNADEKRFVGLAVIIHADGTVVTDSAIIDSEHTYRGVLFDGSEKLLSLVRFDPKEKTALLQFVRAAEDILAADAGVVVYPSVKFADPSKFKIGQTVFILSGSVRDEAGTGILSSMQFKDQGNVETASGVASMSKSPLSGLGTSIRADVETGGPLLNKYGEFMAVAVIGATNNPGYVPVNTVIAQLKQFHDQGVAVHRTTVTETTPEQ